MSWLNTYHLLFHIPLKLLFISKMSSHPRASHKKYVEKMSNLKKRLFVVSVDMLQGISTFAGLMDMGLGMNKGTYDKIVKRIYT